MEINDLNKIEKVEVPPFLFTRIQQQIENLTAERFTKKTVVITSISVLLLVLINLTLIVNTESKERKLENYMHAMNLKPTNSLYR